MFTAYICKISNQGFCVLLVNTLPYSINKLKESLMYCLYFILSLSQFAESYLIYTILSLSQFAESYLIYTGCVILKIIIGSMQ